MSEYEDGYDSGYDNGKEDSAARIAKMVELLRLGQVMRDRQRAYFKERSQGALVVSKQTEAEFDAAVAAALAAEEDR